MFTRPRSSDVSSSTSQRTAVTVDVKAQTTSSESDACSTRHLSLSLDPLPLHTTAAYRKQAGRRVLNCERERERGAHFVSTVHHRYDVISICTRHVILAGARAPSGSAKQHGVVATHHRRNLVDIVFTFNSVIDINELSLRHHRRDQAKWWWGAAGGHRSVRMPRWRAAQARRAPLCKETMSERMLSHVRSLTASGGRRFCGCSGGDDRWAGWRLCRTSLWVSQPGRWRCDLRFVWSKR